MIYDVVIIGSGIGSLFCGALLSSQGKKVCVLEKHSKIGGNLQTFTRKGCSFSPGMHYGGSLDKGQLLYKIFTYLGIYNNLNLTKLDEKCFDKILIGDKEYCYAMGMDNLKKTLLKYFPNEEEAINIYTNKLNEIWDASDLINLRETNFNQISDLKKYEENAYEFINSISDNDELKAVLAATNGLYAGNKYKTPLYIHAYINSFFIKSAWRIAEDGDKLSGNLARIITNNGGKVLIGKEVVKFAFKGKNVYCVKVKSGEIYKSNNFISGIHPVQTFKLIEDKMLRKAYVNRINRLENSISVFMLFVVLKKKKFKHFNSNIYYSKTNKVWDNCDYTEETWPKGYMMYTTEDKINKEFAESVVVISMMKYEEVRQWEHTKVLHRGDNYNKFKKKKEKKFLNLVYERFPHLKDSIDTVYSASPLTFRDYTGTVQGSMYGIVKDCKDPLGTFLSPKTRIPNLLLTGQNIGIHGLLGVVFSAFKTCSLLIDVNRVIKEIREYEEEI